MMKTWCKLVLPGAAALLMGCQAYRRTEYNIRVSPSAAMLGGVTITITDNSRPVQRANKPITDSIKPTTDLALPTP